MSFVIFGEKHMDLNDDVSDIPGSYYFKSDNDKHRDRMEFRSRRKRKLKVHVEKGQHRAWTQVEEKALMVLVGDNYTAEQIAEKLNRQVTAVAAKIVVLRKEVEESGIDHDWRADMEKRAVVAVNAGLDATEDPYKRAAVGGMALKGLRVFEPDMGVNIAAVIGQIPAEHRARYLSLDEEKEPADG
jgi:hypothetical protein